MNGQTHNTQATQIRGTAQEAAQVDKPFVNIAAYLFTPLDRLDERRQQLRTFCKDRQLKGTILLSPEGINIFMAGLREPIDELLALLHSDTALVELKAKESFSATQPFSRLLVKLKKEIIAFGVEGIAPRDYTSKKISPQQLKQWLDAGQPLTLLDTRNDYEVELGTFENALPIGVDHFREFPEAVKELPGELKQRPVVMFCTGGIRCEKAGPLMEREGFQDVYQLDGGILKYFEDCGAAHYRGDCFVFDHRVAVDPRLQETAATQCYICQHPLTEQQQQSPKYVVGQSCPFCWQDPAQKVEPTIADRLNRLREISTPLPGSLSYTNQRPLNVPERYQDWTLLDFLADFHPHISKSQWAEVCQQQLIHYKEQPWPADKPVWASQRLIRLEPNTVEPDVNAQIRIVAWQSPLIVFDKPAPLPIHPCGRFNKNSLTSLLDLAFPDQKLRPAHRLDANTTGLIVFTNHRDASLRIQRQFERGEAEKTYLCRVIGQPSWKQYRCEFPISKQTTNHGGRNVDFDDGAQACTEFSVEHQFDDGTTLLTARPLTGRTNQIRVHLWHLGHPIVGDPTYLPARQQGQEQTLPVTAEPMCLHAWKLTLLDPEDRQPLQFATDKPDWAKAEDSHKHALENGT